MNAKVQNSTPSSNGIPDWEDVKHKDGHGHMMIPLIVKDSISLTVFSTFNPLYCPECMFSTNGEIGVELSLKR